MAKKEKDAEEEVKTRKGDEEDGAEDGEEAGEGLSRKKIIIIAAAVAVLLVGGAAGLYFTGHLPFLKRGATATTAETKAPEEKAAESSEPAKKGKDEKGAAPSPLEHHEGQAVYYHLPEFLVNLNTGGKQASFLKMQIAVELPSEKDAAALEGNLPRIQDDFNTYLRELRPSDLSGSAGLYRLKEELLTRINKIISHSTVNDILFKEILVQ
jgi:flagellar FliL protein